MNGDRREESRFVYAINVTYMFGDGTTMRVAKTSNICQSGMSLMIDQSCQVNDSIKFIIDETKELFEAKVIWCQKVPATTGSVAGRQDYQIGIQYKDVIAEKVNEILKELGAYEG